MRHASWKEPQSVRPKHSLRIVTPHFTFQQRFTDGVIISRCMRLSLCDIDLNPLLAPQTLIHLVLAFATGTCHILTICTHFTNPICSMLLDPHFNQECNCVSLCFSCTEDWHVKKRIGETKQMMLNWLLPRPLLCPGMYNELQPHYRWLTICAWNATSCIHQLRHRPCSCVKRSNSNGRESPQSRGSAIN